MFAEYIGQYKIERIEFENLTLGTLPPTIQGTFLALQMFFIKYFMFFFGVHSAFNKMCRN